MKGKAAHTSNPVLLSTVGCVANGKGITNEFFFLLISSGCEEHLNHTG